MVPPTPFERIYESGSRRVLYGVLGRDGLVQRQLRELDEYFCCGLMVDDPIESIDWKQLFEMLVGAGCRALCVWPTEPDLEDIFDRVAINSGLEADTSAISVLWSTTHANLEDMLRFTLLSDLSDAYVLDVGSVILLQYGEIDRREFCRVTYNAIDQEENN